MIVNKIVWNYFIHIINLENCFMHATFYTHFAIEEASIWNTCTDRFQKNKTNWVSNQNGKTSE